MASLQIGATLPIGCRYMGKAALMGRASGTLVRHCTGCRTGAAVSRALPGRRLTVVTPEAVAPWAVVSPCWLRQQSATRLFSGAAIMSRAHHSTHLRETRSRWSATFSGVLGKAPVLSAAPSRLSVPASILVGIGGGRRLKISATESLGSGLPDRDGGRVFDDGVRAAAGGASVGKQTGRTRR